MSRIDTRTNHVIDAYVVDVMRRIPGKDRQEVGLELRGLLTEMLDERAQVAGRVADDAMVLAMLRDFGTPAGIAARYRPAAMVILPAEQTRSFVVLSLVGLGLQWALTLPRVFDGSLPIAAWWFSWGLGAFWWPGFMAMMALLVAWLRSHGLLQPRWTPRIADPDRVDRGGMVASLVGVAVATGFMIALPWLVDLMPPHLAHVFAFDSRLPAHPCLARGSTMAGIVRHPCHGGTRWSQDHAEPAAGAGHQPGLRRPDRVVVGGRRHLRREAHQ